MSEVVSTALSIAGSDPSGGAGIQADLKAFSARGVYGMTVITALTAQNTRGVQAIEVLSPSFVRAQIDAVFEDVRVGAVKVGMIANAGIATAVAEGLREHTRQIPIVLDPVMVAKGGAALLQPDAVQVLKEKLVPEATLITPNLPEAASLLGCEEAQSASEMEAQAQGLAELGPQAVLLKGGHLSGEGSPDLLVVDGESHWFSSERIETENTHGTGCTLSAALAAELAKGYALLEAVKVAKAYVSGAIRHADSLSIGQGHGPTHHFFELWEKSSG